MDAGPTDAGRAGAPGRGGPVSGDVGPESAGPRPGGLRIEGLGVALVRPSGEHPILHEVSLEVPAGLTAGLVGPSGAGKSMTAYAVLRLFPVPARITAGRILFDGTDLVRLPEQDLTPLRGRRIAMIFQEPASALDPVMSVGNQVMEGIVAHFGRRGAREQAAQALGRVGLDPGIARRYPHELSGGQRQRVLIASAIALRPSLLIADEPTAALDVTVQAQVLDLLGRLQRDLGMSLLLITHDLGIVAQMCDLVHVMRDGTVVESAETRRLFAAPRHPYTRTLIERAQRLGLGPGG